MDMIKLLADKTWWPDGGHLDSYRTANYDLWMKIKKDVIEECTMTKDRSEKRVKMRTQSEEVRQLPSLPVLSSRYNSADPRYILRQNQWPVALMNNYPQLGEILNRSRFQNDSYFSRDSHLKLGDNCNLPFSINTLEELELYHKTSSSGTRNIWENSNDFDKKMKDNDDVLNRVSQLQSYPSVSLPPLQCPAPRLPNVFDSAYENEVFPYSQIDQSVQSEEKAAANEDMTDNNLVHLFQPMFQPFDTEKHDVTSSKPENSFRDNLNWFNECLKNVPVENLEQTLAWLRTVYPRRTNDFQCLNEMIKIGFQVDEWRRPFGNATAGPYDELVARKLEQLEYEGMVQYLQSSETSLVSASEDTTEARLTLASNSDIERQFERLEKEAVEQFKETEDDEEDFLEQYALFEENTRFFAGSLPLSRSPSASDSIDLCRCAVESKISSENATEDWKDSSAFESDGPSANAVRKKQYSKLSKDKKQAKMKKYKKMSQAKQPSPKSVNIKAEISRLAASLKYKVFNYLKSADSKINELDKKRTSKKVGVRKNGDTTLIQHIKVTDIKEADTFHKYAKEFSQKVRNHLEMIYKRIRVDLMDSISKDHVQIVEPSTAEKRKTRRMISKCLELSTVGNNIQTGRRHLIAASIKVVNETLKNIHKTMEVVYNLRDMTRETFEAVEYLKNGQPIIARLYRGEVTMYDIPEYVRLRLLWERRSILLQLLCSKKRSIFSDEPSCDFKDIFDDPNVFFDPSSHEEENIREEKYPGHD